MAHDHFYGICENKCLVEIKQDNIPGRVGKDLTGQTVSIAYDKESGTETKVVAAAEAEIFNDYRERTYNAEGTLAAGNVASGFYSHAEGCKTTASGNDSHAEGCETTASSNQAHAEGYRTTASGMRAHAEGQSTTASGGNSHAEGGSTTASGDNSHAEGYKSKATKNCSHAEGNDTTSSGSASHAEGFQTTASGHSSHAEGFQTKASGVRAHAEGYQTEASGWDSHASGHFTIANECQFVCGKSNKPSAGPSGSGSTTGDIFIIGNGSDTGSRSNAFRVTTGGAVYGRAAYNSSGADYAEMWEIEGGNPDNEDWRGLFVTVNENNKISKANSNDYILGVISATPCVVGDVQSEVWHNMYLKDVFGEHLTETVEVEETTDEFGNVTPAHTETRWILNPDYDSSKEYISRDERPEWAAVGLMGKLIVIDDGTCKPGQFCKVADGGIATASGNNEGYRVLERKDENHIQILFR